MRGRPHLAALVVVLSAASQVAVAAPCPRGTLTGKVTFVRDGDTIVVGSMPIRLNGLAAPEWDEPGGDAAMDAMLELVEGRTLRCELNGERTHDRCVGICYLEGKDISAAMVAAGVARDCPRFSGGRYQQAEVHKPQQPARRSGARTGCRGTAVRGRPALLETEWLKAAGGCCGSGIS